MQVVNLEAVFEYVEHAAALYGALQFLDNSILDAATATAPLVEQVGLGCGEERPKPTLVHGLAMQEILGQAPIEIFCRGRLGGCGLCIEFDALGASALDCGADKGAFYQLFKPVLAGVGMLYY